MPKFRHFFGFEGIQRGQNLLLYKQVIFVKGKRVAFVCLMLSFVLLISGGVTSFLVSLKEDRELTLKRMVVVNDEFEDFSNSTTSFESYRDELYNNVLGSLYYDSLGADDANIKNVLSNYEAMVDSLEKKAKSLDNLCKNVYYPDSSVNSKCNNYKSIFEQVNNFFVGDIALYNKNIDSYNTFQLSNGSTVQLQYYTTKKEYIDYDDNGTYDGKLEEEKKEEAKEEEKVEE